jgi:agmatine/peptidylarginine deiminase
MNNINQHSSNLTTLRLPAEWEPHAWCWMAWAVHREWRKAVNKVKRELSDVIHTISRFELAQAFPRREIIMLRIDHIADGGGGVHCLTQPIPAIPREA